MTTQIPSHVDDEAFAYVADLSPFGVEDERLMAMLPGMLRNAKLHCMIDPAEHLPSWVPVDVQPGALLKYPQGEWSGLILHLRKTPGAMEFVGLWPQVRSGGRLVAELVSLIKSSDGCQAHAELRPVHLPGHSLWVHLPEYGCSPGFWERGGVSDFRPIGLPIQIGPADLTPVRVGPDAPSYASMRAAGLAPGADGVIELQTEGLAALIQRPDIAPNVYEFRGAITAIRDGGEFMGASFRIADAQVLRSDDDPGANQALSLVITDSVWSGVTFPEVGDNVQGLAMLQATAVGAATDELLSRAARA